MNRERRAVVTRREREGELIMTRGPSRAKSSRAPTATAVPTLVRKPPVPSRKIIGDRSDTGTVLIGLQVR